MTTSHVHCDVHLSGWAVYWQVETDIQDGESKLKRVSPANPRYAPQRCALCVCVCVWCVFSWRASWRRRSRRRAPPSNTYSRERSLRHITHHSNTIHTHTRACPPMCVCVCVCVQTDLDNARNELQDKSNTFDVRHTHTHKHTHTTLSTHTYQQSCLSVCACVCVCVCVRHVIRRR